MKFKTGPAEVSLGYFWLNWFSLLLFLLELAAEFISRPQNTEVLEGAKAEFACSVSKEAFEVQWLRGDTVLEAGEKYDIISDGKKRVLVIKESALDDEGGYSAMVAGSKATARLRVIGKHCSIFPSTFGGIRFF